MSEVVSLPTRPEVVWVCACGCSTFELMGDGAARCATCLSQTDAEQGGWHAPDSAPEWDGDAPVRDIQGNGSVEFARRRLTQLSSADDAVAVIVIREDGTLHAWSNVETQEQFSWLKRQMIKVYRLITRPTNA
jgi:hypothetical protein